MPRSARPSRRPRVHRRADPEVEARALGLAARALELLAPEDDPNDRDPWVPQAGPQREFVESTCSEILYGGQAGGGKSHGLIGLLSRFVHKPGLRALCLRRRQKDLGDLLTKAKEILRDGSPPGRLRNFGPVDPRAKFTGSEKSGVDVILSAGGEIRFGHCNSQDGHKAFDGFEFPIIAFDELTHFTLEQYLFIKARCRSADPSLPRYVRATSNPGGPGHDWVFYRWRFWLDPEAEIPGRPVRYDEDGERMPPCDSGEVLWIRTEDDGEETISDETDPLARSRTFIRSQLSDNPALTEADPDYAKNLRELPLVRRMQLAHGSWTVKPSAKLLFNREWVTEWVPSLVRPIRRVRYWDRAASESVGSDDPDWTVGVRMALYAGPAPDVPGPIVIEHVERFRLSPLATQTKIREVALEDAHLDTVQILEQDPAQAGKFEIASYAACFAPRPEDVVPIRFKARPVSGQGDKVKRFEPFSAAAEHGRVFYVRGRWNTAFFNVLEAFPSPDEHDDDADAAGGAYYMLSTGYSGAAVTTTGAAQKAISVHRKVGRAAW